jgi:hypothetical protein
LKESEKGDQFLKDSHGFYGCVRNGDYYDKDLEQCKPLTPGCSQVDKSGKVCLACDHGYEKYVEMDGLFNPRRWYIEKKQEAHWEKAFNKPGMVQCKLCTDKYIYNSITRECHKSVKDIDIKYKSSHHGRYHYFQGMKVPNFKKNKKNKGMAKMWLELHLATKKPMDNIPMVETHIYYRKPEKPGKCLETKKGGPFKSIYDNPSKVGKKGQTYKEYNRAFFDLSKKYKSPDGATFYYMNWFQLVPYGHEIQVRATIYGHRRDEANYFVKAFKYKFDEKDDKGVWNYNTKQKNAIDLNK